MMDSKSSSPSTGRVGGQVAIVTGAAAGLGRAIADRLSDEGAYVIAVDVDRQTLDQTVSNIRRRGARATGIVCDVTIEAEVKSMVAQAISEFDRLDILVANAGGARPSRIWETTVEDWDFVMGLNLRSTFLCTREVLLHMMPQRSGRIIAMSSGARDGTPWMAYYSGNSSYAAAKAGIHGFVRNAALELAEYGITVNAVAPGPIETEKLAPIFKKLEPLEHSPQKLVPMRRLGRPIDVANTVLFLASSDGDYITGTTISVAGGR